MGFSATSTRSQAYSTIKESARVPKLHVNFKLEEFNLWLRGLLRAAAFIPRREAPADSGHAHLVLDDEAFREFTGDSKATNDEVAAPGSRPVHADDASSAVIANVVSAHYADCERYYTQLGAKDGLRELIVDSADAALLRELKHKIWEYNKYSPLALIKHIKKQAIKSDVVEITDLVAERNSPPTLDGDTSLRVQYGEIDELISTLKNDYNITTSKEELIATHWLIYCQVKDAAFREACLAWDKPATPQDWATFRELFSAADDDRRAREKAATKIDSAKAGGRENINSATARGADASTASAALGDGGAITNDRLALILGQAFQAYDEEVSERINAALETVPSSTSNTAGKEPLSVDALLREIRDLKSELSVMKKDGKGGGSGTPGGGNRCEEWKLTKTADTVTRDDKTWWWCPHHNNGQGCYCRHRPAEHDKWAEVKARMKKGETQQNGDRLRNYVSSA